MSSSNNNQNSTPQAPSSPSHSSTASPSNASTSAASANTDIAITQQTIPITGAAPALYGTNPFLSGPVPVPHDPTVPELITRLLNPAPNMYSADRSTVTLSLVWAIGVCGPEHFEYAGDDESNRRVLRQDSALRLEGREKGLPKEIFEWLCGEQDGETLVLVVEKLRIEAQ